jgi:prepilin-type N-terminal cleavage/methylation domain-containing protein
MTRFRRGQGFTLIELLIVISIIGILMTLVIVTVMPVQRKGRDTKRKSDINLFLSGAELYKADFKVYPNPTLYLGNYGTAVNGGANSNLGLSTDIPACNGLPTTAGATGSFISLNGDSIALAGKPTAA